MILFGGLLIGFGLGIVFGLLSINKKWFLCWFVMVYIEIFWGMLILVQVFFIFYGLFDLIGGLIELLIVGIVVIVLNFGVYILEVVCGGVQFIDKGQIEVGFFFGLFCI